MKTKKAINDREKLHTIYIECSCSDEILKVESNVDKITKKDHKSSVENSRDGVLITEDEFRATEDDDNVYYFQEFWLSLYSYGSYRPKPTFRYKMKRIWEFLKTGEFTADSIIINRESAKQLIKFLQEKLDEFS